LQVRLFLTCWLIYGLHFATEFVREHYLVVSIVDDRSFDLEKYFALDNPDIFRNPPTAPRGGTHHGANPGISMIGAVVYAPFKPLVDRVAGRELASRGTRDTLAVYRDEKRPRRIAFYAAARRMGLDVRFGLVVAITAVLCMAPIAALGVVAFLRTLTGTGLAEKTALALSLVFAFATPVFFRASYLNHNLAIGVFSIAAFLLLWNPGDRLRWSASRRQLLAGFLGGLSVLNDYSGALTLGVLGVYLLWRELQERSVHDAWRGALRYGAAALPPILLLWFYQWQSFGHPFYPPQHWMPPVAGSDIGYQGVGGPQPELLKLLLLDPRTGLLICSPVLALAFVAPFVKRWRDAILPRRELVVCYALSIGYLLFFSAVQYTRLQWVSGGPRYLLPIVPFLFLASAGALLRMPRIAAYGLVLVSFVITWSMTMIRSQTGVLDSLQQSLLGGIRLPALTTYSRMSTQYAPWLSGDASPIPILLLAAVVLLAIWRLPNPWAPLLQPEDELGSVRKG
jgi:hypothetical protein